MESLGYMFVYFARGFLPWQGLKAATRVEKLKLIMEMKMSLSGKDLCDSYLPPEFAKYIDYTRSIRFEDKPNYRYLRQLFQHRFRSEGFKHDNVFDWTIKRFNEVHSKNNST